MADTATTTMPEIAPHEPVIAPTRARRLYFILGIAVVALLVAYAIYALLTAGKESTDDAQVAADVVPVASRVAGQITNVYITENQLVHRSDLIVEIDPRDAQVKVAQAQGDLETARAQAADADARVSVTRANARGALVTAQGAVQSSRENVDTSAAAVSEAQAAVTRAAANAEKARRDWERASELGAKGDISKSQVDAARAANESAQADVALAQARLREAQNARQAAQANVQQAQGKLVQSQPVAAQIAAAEAQARLAHAKVQAQEAALQAAQLTLSYTKITAPTDGIASKLAVHPGSLVNIGQPIVQLVPKQTYVIANFKETQMKHMRPGQRARVRVDALGRQDFEGHVDSLSGGTGASFSLLPPDNASGNFVKVVQRVPVRISWNGPMSDRVPVGSSADVTVYTK
ncbi:MAG TPA: HlyD family secretion protein [Thermoanaerobaculia bacterium]|jgi:membrane fusion protein (multidrug efflux system)|nr:HlyD family secretion protein [Thermoanaerobaculia bacterium]